MNMQSSPLPRRHILLVDHNRDVRRQVCDLLQANGYTVTEAGHEEIAHALFDQPRIDVIVTDICMARDWVAAIRSMDDPIPVIAMVDHESWASLSFFTAANDLDAAAVIEKPFGGGSLLHLVREVLAVTDRHRRVVPLRTGSIRS